MNWRRGVIALLLVLVAGIYLIPREPLLSAPAPDTVNLQDFTWVELRDAIRAGTTTVIVPAGGTEQNGPHMILGKHNYIVRYTSGEIAKRLGHTVVAPVMAYVPEGDIDSREGHMAYAGTLSLPAPVFAKVLEATARSLKAHGFKLIVLLGDHLFDQPAEAAVAKKLTREWAKDGVVVFHASGYYDPKVNRQIAWLEERGETWQTIGGHAGIRDTSELMVVHPDGIRMDRIAPGGGHFAEMTGVNGDPTRASVKRGKILLDLKIKAAVREISAIRSAMQAKP